MTDQPITGRPQAMRDPRAKLLAVQTPVNRVIRGLLRAPLLSRLAGRRLITVYVTGRKSGRRYAVPVAYTRHEGDLLIGTPFGWGRNLRTGEPVTIRLKGRRRLAEPRVPYHGDGAATDHRGAGRVDPSSVEFSRHVARNWAKARARWLNGCFSAGSISPNVFSLPAGRNIGS